jgi:SnoaL-like domain
MGMNMGMNTVEQWAELEARQRIVELVTRRGRAADAKDPDAILVEHVPGSGDTHGIFDGTIEDFVEYLRVHHYSKELYGLQRHTVSNVLVDFDSPTSARVESYHIAYHRLELADGPRDVRIGGRYLDHVTVYGGRWRLSSRSVVYDWSRSHTPTAQDGRRSHD